MPRALISVSDKRGIVEFAHGLVELGWQIVSTGGTAAALRKAEIPVTTVEEVTGFPEILDGRVKTLHPAIHAGLLARPDLEGHRRELASHKILPFDLVAVNLYPFQSTIARASVRRSPSRSGGWLRARRFRNAVASSTSSSASPW